MKISIKGFIYHKAAEKYSDCFDRYGHDINYNKFAISDGVSKSFFPDVWAELLVESFVKQSGRININNIETFKLIQKEWNYRVEEIVNKPNQRYFVKNFFIQGRPAAATFVGLHFFLEKDEYYWEAVALGDSFMFFIPSDNKTDEFDFEKLVFLSSKKDFEFNNFPDFFDSRNLNHKGKMKLKSGSLKPGTFYLMTDALSEWFLTEKSKAIEQIEKWNTQDDFEKSVDNLRESSLHNDDSTILIIKIENDETNSLIYNDVLVTNFDDLIIAEKKLRPKPESENIDVQNLSNSTSQGAALPTFSNEENSASNTLKQEHFTPLELEENTNKKDKGEDSVQINIHRADEFNSANPPFLPVPQKRFWEALWDQIYIIYPYIAPSSNNKEDEKLKEPEKNKKDISNKDNNRENIKDKKNQDKSDGYIDDINSITEKF